MGYLKHRLIETRALAWSDDIDGEPFHGHGETAASSSMDDHTQAFNVLEDDIH
jgi:hypothetical protein